MAIDLSLLANKLSRYRTQFLIEIKDLANATGIDQQRLQSFESATTEPTGDEILILADYYRCDYHFFISNETKTSFEETEILFRKYGDELSTNDRWAIQEVLFLSECETYLESIYEKTNIVKFSYSPQGTYYKKHGIEAANKLRETLNERANKFNLNIYDEFKKIGLRIYRRRLENSKISGVCIQHPISGKCLLINYDTDVYRQRFTVAHEVAHSIFDSSDSEPTISYSKWDKTDLKEIRANTFAATYLIPNEILHTIPENEKWNKEKLIEWSNKIQVNTKTFLIALKNNSLINDHDFQLLEHIKIPYDEKKDPEFFNLSEKSVERKKYLLERGLTFYYINKCRQAVDDKIISLRRMAEMLLITESELFEISKLFNLGLKYES